MLYFSTLNQGNKPSESFDKLATRIQTASPQHKQRRAVLLQPLFGGLSVWSVTVDRCPKLRAVVGMGKVAELVDAHVVNHEIGRTD